MIKKTFTILSLSFIILASLVIAAGSSTGSGNNNAPARVTASQVGTVSTCEDIETVEGRIKCRLENRELAREEKNNSVEEACRSGSNATKRACEALYQRSARCYQESNNDTKRRCLLQESGINFNKGGTFRAASEESKRNYVVLLLYELQERIENAQQTGKITSDQAASLIAKIVEIKKMTIAGDTRANIVVKINEFRKEFKNTFGGA
jgi:hypothetical protein